MRTYLLGVVFTAGALSGAEVAPVRPVTPSPPAVVPLEQFEVPEGLEITVWARTPLLRNPTNIDIDAQGRIWVTEGVNYRGKSRREPLGDRIMVLEDTDGDGKADVSRCFVQEPSLLAPLGIAVIDNKIVVANAPDMIVYTDVDRDGHFDPAVDSRDVLLSGFEGRNHDHGLHSVTFGVDGKWYFNHGNCGALFTDRSGHTFRVGGAYDPWEAAVHARHRALPFGPPAFAGAKSDDGHVYVGGAAYRMNSNGTGVEVIGFNFRNSYEQTITSYGDVFQNDNDDVAGCRTTFLMEYGNLGFFSRDGKRDWRADKRLGQNIATAHWRQDDPGHIPAGDVYGGGSPTGIVFYEGDALGEKWRGLLLSCEPSRNVVFGYFPQTEGAGYTLDRFDFLTSNPERNFAGTDFTYYTRPRADAVKAMFRPSDVAVGPDGAIYVSDWFDPRVGGHGTFDDLAAGAIYRIAPKGFRSVVPAIDPSTLEGQITALKSPAPNVRAIGFSRLLAGGERSVAPVAELLRDQNPYIRARAVFLLAQLGESGIRRVEASLRDVDPMLRIAAFRALRRAGRQVIQWSETLVNDPSPAVRREVALALRDIPFAASRDLLLRLAIGFDGSDRAYLEAWGTGCSGKEAEVAKALKEVFPHNRDPLQWSAAYAGLMWRLTPDFAVPDFMARAQAKQLRQSDRLSAVTSLGYIATQASAEALIELAAHSESPIKDHALSWLLNYKSTRWSDFDVDTALKLRGLYDPDKIVINEIKVPEEVDASEGMLVSDVAQLTGDPAKGAMSAQLCLMCHRIGDKGVYFGPDLTGLAKRQSVETLITAILRPSEEITHGYDTREVITTDGIVVQGIGLNVGGDPLLIQSIGGVTQMIPAKRIQSVTRVGHSLMLSARQLGLQAQDVADVIAYLKTQ